MNKDLISIIIPVYNKEKYIEKTINSFLRINDYDIEIIIVNDGSTDGSMNIINKYIINNDFISVYTIKNSGVSNARNYGLGRAKGKWILFFDADDYVDTKELQHCFFLLNKYEPDILFSGIKKVNHDGKILNSIQFSKKGFYNELEDVFCDFAQLQEETGLYGCVSNKIIKSSIIKKNNIKFNTNIRLAEDFDFFLDVYRNINNCYYYENSYLYYLQNAENSSTSLTYLKNPNYFTQTFIKYKEYILLKDKNISNLDILEKRIADFFLLYLRHNYIYEKQNSKDQLELISTILKIINIDHLSKIDQFLIILYKKNYLYLLKGIIFMNIQLRNIYHAVRR